MATETLTSGILLPVLPFMEVVIAGGPNATVSAPLGVGINLDNEILIQDSATLSVGAIGGSTPIIIDGGTLILNDYSCLPFSCIEPNVSFSGTGNLLEIANSKTPSDLTEGEQIYGFSTGDKIDFQNDGAPISNQISSIYSGGQTEFTVTTTNGIEEFYLNGNLTGQNYSLGSDGNGGFIFQEQNPCFLKGTKILTEDGEILVENLYPDLNVITSDNRFSAIKFIGKRRLKTNPKVAPVRFPAGSLADGIPSNDLLVSPDHALFFDDIMVEAKNLIDGAMIAQDHSIRDITYYHVELDSHDVIIANGTPVESFLDCGHRGLFENSNEPMILHPDLMETMRREKSLFPIAVPGDKWLPSIREMLRNRAFKFGYQIQEQRAVSLVLEDSSHIIPISVNGELVFNLPENISKACLKSESFVPAEIDPASDDRRVLGIAISEMKVNNQIVSLDIFDSGIYQGNDPSSWTNGNAYLSLPNGTRKISLKIVGYPIKWQLPKFKKFG